MTPTLSISLFMRFIQMTQYKGKKNITLRLTPEQARAAAASLLKFADDADAYSAPSRSPDYFEFTVL